MNVYYIGGSPCCGKSTIGKMIAKEYGLYFFEVDDSLGKYASMGAKAGYSVCKRQWKLSPDETWLWDPQLMCRQELQFYREIAGFIQEELQEISGDRDILTEGAAYLPEVMKAMGVDENHYFCMTPVREFQIQHYRKREWVPLMLEGCSDRERAFANWMERDVLFAESVRQQCREAGYRSVVINGKQSVLSVKELVCRCFFG